MQLTMTMTELTTHDRFNKRTTKDYYMPNTDRSKNYKYMTEHYWLKIGKHTNMLNGQFHLQITTQLNKYRTVWIRMHKRMATADETPVLTCPTLASHSCRSTPPTYFLLKQCNFRGDIVQLFEVIKGIDKMDSNMYKRGNSC